MRGVFADFQKSLANAVVTALTITGVLTLGANSRIAGHLIPSANNTYDVGSVTSTWRSGYFGTSLASPAISVTSTGAGITLYNTTDQVTNFEKGNAYWSSNVFTISTSRGGTGTNRDLKLYNEGWGSSDGMVFSAGGGGICFFCITRSSGNANTAITRITGTNTASSHTSEALQLDPTINQSGTAGYNVLSIDPTITAEGSGGTKLLRLAVGGTDQFYIDKNGYTYAGGSYGSLAEGDGYYFGDSSRGLRYLTGDDFEFRNWYLDKRYETSYNGSTSNRFVVFDAATKRTGFSDTTTLLNFVPTTTVEVIGLGVSTTRLYVGGGQNQYTIGNVQASVVDMTLATSTLQVGSTTKKSCLILGDIDGAGVTYVTALDGELTASTNPCNP